LIVQKPRLNVQRTTHGACKNGFRVRQKIIDLVKGDE
jgi:hypothetical protein